MALIGISGRARHFHSFSKFLEHFGKIHLCCGPSLCLYPREFTCKIWNEKDLKKILNLLHFEEIRKSVFSSQGESSALTTVDHRRSTAAWVQGRAGGQRCAPHSTAPEAEGWHGVFRTVPACHLQVMKPTRTSSH